MVQMADWAGISRCVVVMMPNAPERRANQQHEEHQGQRQTPNLLFISQF
jgi:hypothetical protein